MSNGLKLKLNVGGGSQNPAPPPPPTPVATPGESKPKLKLTNSSNPPTPAGLVAEEVNTKKTKAGRTTKPSTKLLEGRKRRKDEIVSDDEDESTVQVQPPPKKIKFNFGPKTPGTPGVFLKAKIKGKAPERPLGDGYDSEASDRELDPTVEESFILRMLPGEDCDYLRKAITLKTIGLSRSQGGADVQMKFFHELGRRAAVTIKGHVYAATLVDLPCIIEGMKSWDRKGWLKSVDICQMLWVFSPINKEDDAKTIPLPKIIDPETYQYPHGLTPPMHFARKRRFRKRISRTAIEAVEDEVERLLAADEEASSTRWEIVDPDAGATWPGRAQSPGESSSEEDYSNDEDADGEADDMGYFNINPVTNNENDIDADLEADLEAAMQAESLTAATPVSAVDLAFSMPISADHIEGTEGEEEDDSGDESDEEEGDDDIDDEGTATRAHNDRMKKIQALKDDILDLEVRIANVKEQLPTVASAILKKRLEDNHRTYKSDLQSKLSSLADLEEG